MADEIKEIGQIVWADLTIPNAEKVREFYLSVTGWEATEFKMGDYSDYAIENSAEQRDGGGHLSCAGGKRKLAAVLADLH